jgi:hypothetical protein
MTPIASRFRLTASTVALTAALGSLSLAGCNQPVAQNPAGAQPAADASAPPALPLTTAAEPTSAAAPPPSALPSAPPVRVVHVADQSQAYAYADRAYRYASVLADAPPDYTFDYDGVRPYVWQSNGSYQFAEPTPDGERYYYYDPGSDYPYLIRDHDYSYGYDNGQLVVIYDRDGRIMDPSFIDQRADLAGRYLARARVLRAAALHSQHQAVAVANWTRRRQEIDADRAQWEQEQQQYPDWRAYDQAHEDQERAYWAGVQERRAAESQAYNQALGAAYGQGRADQRGQDRTGLEVAGGVAALAAAAAIYNAGHHDHDRPPPAAAPGPGPRPGPEPGPGLGPDQRQGFAGTQPQRTPMAPTAVAPAPHQGVRPGPDDQRRLAAGPPAAPGGVDPRRQAEAARQQAMAAQKAQTAAALHDHQAQAAAQAQAEAQRAAQVHGQQQAAAERAAQQAAAAQTAHQAEARHAQSAQEAAQQQAAARQAAQAQARAQAQGEQAQREQAAGAAAAQRQAQAAAAQHAAQAAQVHAQQQQQQAAEAAAQHAAQAAQARAAQQQHAAEAAAAQHAARPAAVAHPPAPPPAERDKRPAP